MLPEEEDGGGQQRQASLPRTWCHAAEPPGSAGPGRRAHCSATEPWRDVRRCLAAFASRRGSVGQPRPITCYGRIGVSEEEQVRRGGGLRARAASRWRAVAALESRKIFARVRQVPTSESDDPFELLASARDPYGRERKQRAGRRRSPPPAADRNKGNFREGLGPDAPPSALVDARLSRFHEMGFSVADAERALAACGNDVDAALTELLRGRASPGPGLDGHARATPPPRHTRDDL